MNAKHLLPVAVTLVVLLLAALPTPAQARHIKVYTFNGPSRRTPPPPPDDGCLDTLILGTVSFVSNSVWKVGKQEWSADVTATGCNKTTFYGGRDSVFCADCRKNNDEGGGDMFSWKAVNKYKDQLCTNGWRVPAKSDFIALDIALGGTGNYASWTGAGHVWDYREVWGASSEGYINSAGTMWTNQGEMYYWSQTEDSATKGFCLNAYWPNLNIYPQGSHYKGDGFTLRCVRDI